MVGMYHRIFGRLVGVLALVMLAGACGAVDEPEAKWVTDEAALAERQVALDRLEARERLDATVRELGGVGADHAECIADALTADDDDALVALFADDGAPGMADEVAQATRRCGADETVVVTWIPELGVELPRYEDRFDCVTAEARPWVTERFAVAVADPETRSEADERVDHDWLAGVVDRCDAGGPILAARAELVPQVGADALTPRRWLCLSDALGPGYYDDLAALDRDDLQERLEEAGALTYERHGCD